jgi:recA bacterial DNA recombination protein
VALVELLFEDTSVKLPSARPRPGLTEVAQRVRPVVLAGERRLAVPGALGEILPGGGLQRGSVVRVEGAPGSGATSLLLSLLAAATAAGEWAALVDGDGVLGGLAAAEAGVALERLAVVRAVPAALHGRVVATLLDGVTVVGATIPRGFRLADARRLEARARERAAVLVTAGSWPGEAALRLRAEHSEWSGLGRGEGLLGGRVLRVAVTGRGAAGRERIADVVTGVRPAA